MSNDTNLTIDVLKDLEECPNRLKILKALEHGDPEKTTKIANQVDLSSSLVSHHAKILVRNDLIERRVDNVHKARLHITKKGRQAIITLKERGTYEKNNAD